MSNEPTVVLTGASAGIGLATLDALTEDAFVIAISRTQPPLHRLNGCWLQGDLRTPEPIADQITKELQAGGRSLDGVIHCAVSYGIDHRHPFLETPASEWDEVMAVNTRSQFVLTSRLLPLLLVRPRAFILALSSDAATRPAPERIAYGCSKAASYALFSGLSAELSGSSVSVIQMQPEQQVVTRGIRRRRPHDFDFSGYSSPNIFREPMRSVVKSRGEGMNGQLVLVRSSSSSRSG